MEIINKQRCQEMAQKTGPLVEVAFKTLKYELGGKLPADFSMGYVAGYLRANGMTLEESMFGASRFYEIIIGMVGESKTALFDLKIAGFEDGTANIKMEEVK